MSERQTPAELLCDLLREHLSAPIDNQGRLPRARFHPGDGSGVIPFRHAAPDGMRVCAGSYSVVDL